MAELGIGVSTSVGIGGDPINGSSFRDILELFEARSRDRRGHDDRRDRRPAGGRGRRLGARPHEKPVVAYVAGLSAPKGRKMGHAGAIISAFGESAQEKVEILSAAGITVAPNPRRWARPSPRYWACASPPEPRSPSLRPEHLLGPVFFGSGRVRKRTLLTGSGSATSWRLRSIALRTSRSRIKSGTAKHRGSACAYFKNKDGQLAGVFFTPCLLARVPDCSPGFCQYEDRGLGTRGPKAPAPPRLGAGSPGGARHGRWEHSSTKLARCASRTRVTVRGRTEPIRRRMRYRSTIGIQAGAVASIDGRSANFASQAVSAGRPARQSRAAKRRSR